MLREWARLMKYLTSLRLGLCRRPPLLCCSPTSCTGTMLMLAFQQVDLPVPPPYRCGCLSTENCWGATQFVLLEITSTQFPHITLLLQVLRSRTSILSTNEQLHLLGKSIY
ncbi:hypothetical protein JOM56_014628 [Amanita muscaria]